MSVFTDDDLKRLKEEKELLEPELEALLARLEAAEALINHAVSLGAWEIESRKKLYEAWLKSAGRAERCERSEREGR